MKYKGCIVTVDYWGVPDNKYQELTKAGITEGDNFGIVDDVKSVPSVVISGLKGSVELPASCLRASPEINGSDVVTSYQRAVANATTCPNKVLVAKTFYDVAETIRENEEHLKLLIDQLVSDVKGTKSHDVALRRLTSFIVNSGNILTDKIRWD